MELSELMKSAADLSFRDVSGVGLYEVPLAARILRENSTKVRSWIDGYGSSAADPIIRRQLPKIGGRTVFGFLDLIEARFIKHFCDLGLSPQSIRSVSAKLRERHRTDHPFATKNRFRTDGRAIFMEMVETEEERRTLNLMNDNFEMGEVIRQSLFDTILYADDIAIRWHPIPEIPRVVLDPKYAFGRPVIDGVWVPTDILYDAFMSDTTYQAAADEFEVEIDAVKQAVRFERALEEGVVN